MEQSRLLGAGEMRKPWETAEPKPVAGAVKKPWETAAPSPETAPIAPAPEPSMAGRVWDGLAKPEALAKEGLGAVARGIQKYYPSAEPTGNLPRDLALNAPKAMAESVAETAAKVVPPFVSRGSILTAGALKGLQYAAPVGEMIAKGAEGVSGLEYKTPGVLTNAFNKSSLLFGKGKAAAGEIYDAVLNRANLRPAIAEELDPQKLIKIASKALKDGTLNADEALVARQATDLAKKGTVAGNFLAKRAGFDAVAKPLTAEADAAYQSGRLSDALRQPLAVNKGGGTSIGKMAVAGLVGGAGGHVRGGEKQGALVANLAMSPLAQGAVATGLGMAIRNPEAAAGLVGAYPAVKEAAAAPYNALMRRLQRK